MLPVFSNMWGGPKFTLRTQLCNSFFISQIYAHAMLVLKAEAGKVDVNNHHREAEAALVI